MGCSFKSYYTSSIIGLLILLFFITIVSTLLAGSMAEDYALDRGQNEPQRLETQHKAWIRNLGYHVHPSIASRLDASSRIADIGTGTGTFLIELSGQLPKTCQLDGFDNSDALHPSPATLPSNVSLTLQDARYPFLTALNQTYDFIHIRLMVLGLEKDEWEVIVASAVRSLRPDGAIQWSEADFLGSKWFCGAVGSVPQNLECVGRCFHEGTGHRLQYGYSTLPLLFEQARLRNIFQDVVTSDRVSETREALTRASYDGILGWAYQLCLRKLPGTWTLQEIVELRRKVKEEIDMGCYCRFELYVTIAFVGELSTSKDFS